MRNFIKYLFCILISFPITIVAASQYSDNHIDKYVTDLINSGSSILSDNTISTDVKIAKTSELINKYLDMNWMARFTLGGYRNSLTQDQINQFVSTYSKYIVKAYSNLVKNYDGQKGNVVKIETLSPVEFKAHILITFGNSNKQQINVQYLVHHVDDVVKLKVFDVITEGVSLVNSQQAEFGSIIANSGFDKLLSKLQTKSK